MIFEKEIKNEYFEVYKILFPKKHKHVSDKLTVTISKSKPSNRIHQYTGQNIARITKLIDIADYSLKLRIPKQDIYQDDGTPLLTGGETYHLSSQGVYHELDVLDQPKDWRVTIQSDMDSMLNGYLSGEEFFEILERINNI